MKDIFGVSLMVTADTNNRKLLLYLVYLLACAGFFSTDEPFTVLIFMKLKVPKNCTQ